MSIELYYSNPDHRGQFRSTHYCRSTTADGFEHYHLTGIVIVNVKGESESEWKIEHVKMGIPVPRIPTGKGLRLRHWAPFVTLNSTYNHNKSNNSGHAVDDFFLPRSRDVIAAEVLVQTNLAVRDSDAWIYRVGYSVDLIGNYVDL